MDNVFTVEAKWYEDMWVAISDDILGFTTVLTFLFKRFVTV